MRSQPLQSMADMPNLEGRSLSKTWDRQAAEDLNEKFTRRRWLIWTSMPLWKCIWNSPDAILVLERWSYCSWLG